MAETADVLVVSGAGPYADPWHRFPDTSRRLAEIVAALGHQVEVSDDVESALADPGSRDLLVINIGNPGVPRPPAALAAVRAGLERHLGRGAGLLVVHVSATSMTTMPEWSQMLGGHWVRGSTMHPERSLATITLRTDAHPVVAGLSDFDVFDERYSYLHTNPDITVLCEHEYSGVVHPVGWAREQGPGRVVYDGLGHDTRSYDSPGHVDLLRRAVGWLMPAELSRR